MIRTIGLLLFSFSIVLSGFMLAEKEKKKYKDAEYLLLLVKHLKQEMCLFKTKLSCCYTLFMGTSHDETTLLLSKRAFHEALEKLSVSKKTKERMISFFEALGKGDAEEESLRCGQMIAYLSKEYEQQEKELKNKVKVARTCSICIAGAILLLFL